MARFTDNRPTMKHQQEHLLQMPWPDVLRAQGYGDLCVRAGQLCAIRDFLVTTAVVVALDPVGYGRRY